MISNQIKSAKAAQLAKTGALKSGISISSPTGSVRKNSQSEDAKVEKQSDPIGSGNVTCGALNVRQGAGTNYARIGGLTQGKSFQVYEEKDGWLKIAYGSGYGWISKQYTDYKSPEPPVVTEPDPPVSSFTPYEVMITADIGLRVRNVPGVGGTPAEGSSVLGVLDYGSVVTVTDERNGWFKIEYNGQEGWICGDFVQKYDPSTSGAVSTNGVPVFCQGDPRWGSRGLGTGGNTIKSAGCAMCATAMCLSKIAGREITPAELDEYLDTHNGYSGDNIYWARAAGYIGKTATSGGPDKGIIDACLNDGRPCVIAVRSGGHYVCVAGKNSDGSYIIHDPGDGSIRSGSWNGSTVIVSGYTAGWQLVYFH